MESSGDQKGERFEAMGKDEEEDAREEPYQVGQDERD